MAMLSSKACDVTGIVAVACARHGCFAPNSVANLYRGEQQKNVDWALLKAIETTSVESTQGLLFIYDIVCQYIVHLPGELVKMYRKHGSSRRRQCIVPTGASGFGRSSYIVPSTTVRPNPYLFVHLPDWGQNKSLIW